MTKRIAAVGVALGLLLALLADPDEPSTPDAPLDKAWEFCTCRAIYGHFHRAPMRTVERRDVLEWV